MKIGLSLQHDHSPQSISARLQQGPELSYLRDWIYGGIDGAVTTFAVVTGSLGANLSTRTVIILGVANLVADGISMAASNFLGTRSERDQQRRVEEYERDQIRSEPHGETEEIRQILKQRGFAGKLLDDATQVITSDPELWVKTMVTEEYGLAPELRSEWLSAFATFSAFLLCGVVPLLPFFLGLAHAPTVAMIMTAIVFFAIGSMKSRWSLDPWWKSGAQTLAVGALASGSAYVVGWLLGGVSQPGG